MTGTSAAFTPTGTVTYEFFANGTGAGAPVSTETVTLNADGTVPNSAAHGPLAAGAYSFIAVYSGDGNYTGSTSPVEPLTISQGSSATATEILDATTGQPPSSVLGESVFDTATVTGTPAAFAPTGTVTYEFFSNGTGAGAPVSTQTVTLNADGTVPNSAAHGPLAAGAYSFIAIYSGDGNYTGSTSPVEPLTISQGSSATATEILDATTGQPPSSVLGESVFDTATVTGTPAAFAPTGTVTYEFFSNGTGAGAPVSTETVTLNADGTVPNSAAHGPLAAGAYSFIAIYSGDGNYTGSTSPVEPLTISQGSSATATEILDATTGQPPSSVLGESVFDTATVTGTPAAFAPTGTVTYEFFANGTGAGAPVSTETVTLNADGTVPNSAAHGPLAAGAYSFIAIYSGDSNYTGSTSPVEPLIISQGSSATATEILDATTGQAPSGVLGESVFDTATVTGTPAAFAPTGTVTYEFFANGTGAGAPVSTQTVTLNADGTVPNSAAHGPLAAGAYSFIAIYSGDGNYTGSTSPVEPLTISQGSTATATEILDATTGQSPSGVLGESVFDTATVTGTPAAFAPTGTVTYEFFANGTGAGAPVSTETVTLNADGTVPNSAAHGPLAAGAYSFIAVYSGDGNYTGSTSTSPVEPLTISQGSTATATEILDATTGQPPSGVLGESVFDTATVTGTPAAFAPTGTVTYEFFANGTGTGAPVSTQTVTLNADGTVPNSAAHGPLAAGAYSFIAIYSGDGNYTGSTSPVEPLTISQGSSATATEILDATTGQAPSGVLGESVFDTATVTGTPAAFAPTGTVTYEFFANGTGAGPPVSTQTVTLNADGTVPNSAAQGPLAAGAYSFIAIYSGDGNYTGSTSPVEPLTISQGSSATATEILDATTGQPPSGVLGESVFDTATVTGTPAAFAPTGTVTYEFFANGTGAGAPVSTQTVTLNADGTVPNSAAHGPLAAGAYSFIAIYSGDGNYTGSTSPVEPLIISQGSTATATEILDATTGQPPSGVLGESVFDTATVTGTPAAFAPTGTVTYEFFANGTGAGAPVSTETVTLNADGTVPNSAAHGPLAAGAYSFIAIYSGDSNYTGSTSPVEPLIISQGSSATATEILDATTGQPPSGVLGESVFDTATVTGTPAAFAPTGTVTYEFFSNGTGTGTPVSTETVTLNADGTVPNSAAHGPLAAGAYSFIAIYSGDGNYTGSTSPVEPLTISQGSTATATEILDATTGQPPSGVLGESVFDTATVTGTPAAFAPTGTVTYEFFANGTGAGAPVSTETVTLNADGTVPNSAAHGPLAAGAYSFIAIYSGDGNYTGSTSPVEPLTVNKATPTITTTPIPTAALLGTTLQDLADLAGGGNPAGSITFRLYAPGVDPTVGPATYTETVAGVNGNGLYHTTVGFASNTTGIWHWVATYNGDSNNNSVTSGPLDEPVTVLPQAVPASSNATPNIGDLITNTVTNNGPGLATNVIVQAKPPAGLVLDTGSYAAYEEELARLSGYVYHDEDNDGRFGFDESGIRGVVVTVSGMTNSGALWSRTVTTQEDGYYLFEFLPPGVYSVTHVQPEGYLEGTNAVGNVNGTRTGELVADTAIARIVLPRDGEGIHYDFGEILPASIAGHVYRDDNGNGRWDDGEPPLSGVTLRLTGQDDRHQSVSRTVETDENGCYAFANLRPGTYQVTSVPRNGHVPVRGGVGSVGGTSENGSTVTGIMLLAGTRARNYDFGHAPNRAGGMLNRPNDADGAGTRSARAAADDSSALLAFFLATTVVAGTVGFVSELRVSEKRRGAASDHANPGRGNRSSLSRRPTKSGHSSCA